MRLLARSLVLLSLLALLVLVGCGATPDENLQTPDVQVLTLETVIARPSPSLAKPTPGGPEVDLTLSEGDVVIKPLPLRAGFPFTVTATIHNNTDRIAEDVPVMLYMSAIREEIGYTPFLNVLTVTLMPSQTLPVEVPVVWNFAGGEHQLWVQINRLPDSWQSLGRLSSEKETGDNMVLVDLMVDPFDAYASELCSGRTDVEVGPVDVLPDPDLQRVMVRVHNVGNRAVYNLPVIVLGDQLSGIAYTPAIPPCGGTADVFVEVDRPLEPGESLTVRVNPAEWSGDLVEDDFGNNQVALDVGLAPGAALPPSSSLADYDFSISALDIETPELWILFVTVHNLGPRDAAMVPVRIENESGRKINDAVPLVQGDGAGIAAIRIGYLWTAGGTLTVTVNPEDAKGSYPEVVRENNQATFTLP